MKIRSKLLVLLLTVSLLPALAIVFLTRISIRHLSSQISNDIQTKELRDATEGLTVHVHNYREAIMGSVSSLRVSLQLQVREVENRLVIQSPPLHPVSEKVAYGFYDALTDLSAINEAFRPQEDRSYSKNLNFRQQTLFLAEDVVPQKIQKDAARLWTMTPIYHDLYESNRGRIFWLYTGLENGLYTSYPGEEMAQLPADYDPRIRNWYRAAKEKQGDWVPPSIGIDVASQKLVLTVSAPVFRPDRVFAGVTAIDMTMDNMFAGLKIPSALKEKAELFLVTLGKPEAEIADELDILMHNWDTDDSGNWRVEVQMPKLLSADTDAFGKMLEDLKAEKSGLKIMEYKGKKAIWVYSGRIGRKAVLVMIVPYEVVLWLVEQTQAMLLDENIKHLRRAGFLIFVIVAVAAILSFFQAKKFTKPINQLALAANTLAEGDFSAHADIHTGDELQRLAEVFNDLGPKLHEHEKTQRSLALARAIQQNLLPQRAPEVPGFEIAGRCRYCDETGGDYFDFIHLPGSEKNKIGIVLGDVTGHGVGAALLMASARSILRNASLHFTGDLAELMAEFNDQLSEDTGDDKFMTLFYGALDSESRSLVWASGGHDPVLWYHRKQDAFEELPNTGPLTGYMKNMKYEQAGPITFEAGDILLVGTDGIWEAEDPSGQPYGKERLFEMIRTRIEDSAEQMVDAVIASVEAFSAPVSPSDDITLIIIKAL